jgi:hypothetical protein
MAERPVIFSGPMVAAILAGRKSQTRRLAWREPNWAAKRLDPEIMPGVTVKGAWRVPAAWQKAQIGDRLWVRETWASVAAGGDGDDSRQHVLYRESSEFAGMRLGDFGWPWRPSINMPRWASRITLRVTDVRRQPLQEITYEDCRDEGVTCPIHGDTRHVGCVGLKRGFFDLWDSLHAKPGTTWADNPEVVALSFVKVGGEHG